MNRISLRLGALSAALLLWGSALALPTTSTERGGGDPAPKPALLKPPPTAAPATAALPDTTALLPSGKYVLRLTMNQTSKEHLVLVARNGGAVTLAVDSNETLAGTLDPTGKLQLTGTSAGDQIALAATVQSRHAAGTARVSRGNNSRAGNFTLDPESTVARKPMKQYEAPGTPKAPECGFWCTVKSWFTLG